jgi:hypothetical protein
MLCSHTKKFIYFKTKKTASTSVEVLLEPLCLDSPRPAEELGDMVVNTSGIVGCRGRDCQGKPFYNHMPAAEILSRLGSEIFWSYRKFCVVRNPFDKAISMFWFLRSEQDRQALLSASFDVVRSRFCHFMKTEQAKFKQSGRNNCCDWYIYTINDKIVADVALRYEHLGPDLEKFLESLDMALDVNDLRLYKSGLRVGKEHFTEYYDAEARAIAHDLFRKEIEYFGYSFE